jgi:tight adherence protein B
MVMVVIIFIASSLAFTLVAQVYVNRKYKIRRRVEELITSREEDVNPNERQKERKHSRKSTMKDLLEKITKNIKTTENKRSKLEMEIESAGVPLKVEELITIRVVLFSIFIAITLILRMNFILIILVAFIGWKLPAFYLKRKKETRITNCAQQLPQSLEIMSSAMKSGYSFMQAMQLVSKEMPDPIGIEFQRTIKEINLGVSMELAFDNLIQRLPNKDLKMVVTAVLIQRSTGGNLAQILETIHETISERVRMKDELRALTSQGRMSALVITLLPVGLGLILNVLNPDYFEPMFSHPLGWILLGIGAFSGVLGWIFIQKVVTIEV